MKEHLTIQREATLKDLIKTLKDQIRQYNLNIA